MRLSGPDPDGGPTPDTLILPDGAVNCERLDPDRCESFPGCQVYSGCPSCDGSVTRSCGPEGRVGGPCPAIACFDCHALDEAACQASPQCVAVPGCQDCDGNVGFLGCYNSDEPIPAVDCAAPYCPRECNNLDEASCQQTPGCIAYHDCPDCDGNSTFVGCFGQDDPPPPVGCPPIFCEERCSELDEQACAASASCHGVYQTPGEPCECDAPGCCTTFQYCAEGKVPDCQGPAGCRAAEPECEGPFVVSFVDSCYEGCVLAEACQPLE